MIDQVVFDDLRGKSIMFCKGLRELILYGIIGCVSVVIDFVVFFVLVNLCEVYYQFANVISVAISLLNGFLLNYHFNFKVKTKFWKRMCGFYAVGMFGWLIGAIQLWIYVEGLHFDMVYSKVLAITICMVTQFFLNKCFIFQKDKVVGDGVVEVKKLEWDSAFFGLNVGRIDISAEFDIKQVKDALQKADENQLTYIFVDSAASDKVREELNARHATYIERRVVYGKSIGYDAGQSFSLTRAMLVTPEIEELAYASGWLSRFNKDERLRPCFKKLYRKWLCRDLDSGSVFVCPDVENPLGMVTVTVVETVGHIGLLAVDPSARRKGIGRRLLSGVDSYLSSSGVCECEVVTQGDNLQAMKLYERSGYKIVKTIDVWHLWNESNTI